MPEVKAENVEVRESPIQGLPRDVQVEYLPLLADWFVERHAARVEALRAK